MRKEDAYLGNAVQIDIHDGQRRSQRPHRQLAILLEGAPTPPLGRILEGEQRLPLRVIPALPQDTQVIPPAGLRLHLQESHASLAGGQSWLLHGACRLDICQPLFPRSAVGRGRLNLHFPGALQRWR